MEEMKQIGTIGVDAGLCWVGDPCYLWPDKDGEPGTFVKQLPNWQQFVDTIYERKHDQRGYTDFDGFGVAVNTGMGDGRYPVYATIDEHGTVSSITIKFFEDDDEEEEDEEPEDETDEEPEDEEQSILDEMNANYYRDLGIRSRY